MRIHKPSLLLRLLCLLLLLGCVTLPVHADTGPKPSVVVELTGLDGRECWATLLSTTHSTGPHSSIFRPTESGGRERNHNIGYGYPPDVPEYPIVKAFMAYEESDPEELYFLQFVQDCTGTGQFRWGYYPPREFKLLLYFPETDSFAVSGAFLTRYAFDSYFTADLSGLALEPGGVVSGVPVRESYDHSGELMGLAFRVLLTLALEGALALAFGLRQGKQLVVVLAVNLFTQSALNLALNWQVYHRGPDILLLYLLLEAGVTVTEWLLYTALLPGSGHNSRLDKSRFCAGYALAANLLSFGGGLLLAKLLPAFF